MNGSRVHRLQIQNLQFHLYLAHEWSHDNEQKKTKCVNGRAPMYCRMDGWMYGWSGPIDIYG